MRVVLKQGACCDPGGERDALAVFSGCHAGHVFRCGHDGKGVQLFDIGPEDVVRN